MVAVSMDPAQPYCPKILWGKCTQSQRQDCEGISTIAQREEPSRTGRRKMEAPWDEGVLGAESSNKIQQGMMVEVMSCKMHQKSLLLQTSTKNILSNPKSGSYPSLYSFAAYCHTPPQWQLTFALWLWPLTSCCWKMIKKML